MYIVNTVICIVYIPVFELVFIHSFLFLFLLWFNVPVNNFSVMLSFIRVTLLHFILLSVSVSCFGVRVSVMFHFMFVHYTFSLVWVDEWPPFGK